MFFAVESIVSLRFGISFDAVGCKKFYPLFQLKIQLCDERCSKMSPFPEHFGKCGHIKAKLRRGYCKKLSYNSIQEFWIVQQKEGEETYRNEAKIVLNLQLYFLRYFHITVEYSNSKKCSISNGKKNLTFANIYISSPRPHQNSCYVSYANLISSNLHSFLGSCGF